jgi:outer membrane PBP1 activator LpoA protein
MLHARPHRRQVPLVCLLLAALACGVANAQIAPAHAARRDDIQQADVLARDGRHAEAARLYESAAKRLFGWDARVALLAAREYVAAGQLDDADRLLGRAGSRLRGDDVVLAARVRAELALARNQPQAALNALSALPSSLPAPLAGELLDLQARAAFAAGQPLAGVRAYVERARIVSSAEERDATYRALVEALRARPADIAAVPTEATEAERGWFELAALLNTSTSERELAAHAADWSGRHPNHDGRTLLPQSSAVTDPGAVAASPSRQSMQSLPPGGRATFLAVLLPLSGKHETSGVAVRDGFVAAWLADPADLRPRVRFYDTATDAGSAYARALSDGAQFVVGPLTKEDLSALIATQQFSVPTLALNSLSGGQPPAFLYQFSLDPEQEARAAARRIAHDGLTRGVALYPANAWGRRLQEAFTAELAGTAVELTASQLYDPGAQDFSGPLRAVLGRYGGAGDRDEDNKLVSIKRDASAEAASGPQFAFIAANAATARALKPQLRFQMVYDLPVYATSDAWDPSTRGATEMDGLTFPEMPWVLYGGQDAPALWAALQDDWKTTARGRWRLYAFGFDAFRLATALGANLRYVALNGLTGALEVAADGTVQRGLDWARVSGGREIAAGAGGVLPAPANVP